eukprot:9130001-Lingulodinium_polyedra.AAC.1
MLGCIARRIRIASATRGPPVRRARGVCIFELRARCSAASIESHPRAVCDKRYAMMRANW